MAPLQQVGRHGGPNKCFSEFQKVVECMTNTNTTTYEQCLFLKDDYIECRSHRLERYKNFIIQQNLLDQGKDLEQLGLPFVKKRQFLTLKTLGLVDGDDEPVNVIRL